MINIKFIFGDKGTEASEPQPWLKYNLKKYNIFFDDKKPDLVFVHHRLIDCVPKSCPKVIVERADSSVLFQDVTRKSISEDNTLAVIKTTIVREKKLNNSQICNKRYHCFLINKYANIVENKNNLIEIENKFLDKIYCMIPTSVQDRFYWYKNNIPIEEKDIDVSFVGVVRYLGDQGANVMDWHRLKCVEEIKKIKSIKSFCVVSNSVQSHPLPNEAYKQIIQKSKIVISPWGMGEWNYRDFHAMYQKCVLIKPDSSHVKCYPVDIFKSNERYIPCKLDFSDLQEKVLNVLENYHFYDSIIEKNRSDLVNSWNFDNLSYDFALFIYKIIGMGKIFL